ncbi:MAG: hypothetical protein KJP25_12185 [Gammaproteobacteria bacterium]|nr:hypothetical protein [Gammaproteobacteria bacterium]NND38269.1 hypothetical protein [Pseudomonadales bacterium]MBT8150289.1 hypothetical protein [Gammaproteobacteria bacterium]NNL11850.1 hypothetical protein [Pseudomonadales bacterium]NNM11110.1 hypothetical protein [Pseudomonadales bacterium]
MKKLTALTAAVAMASAMQVAAEVPNGYTAHALAHVYVDVLPNISIGGVSAGGSEPCYSCNNNDSSTSGGSYDGATDPSNGSAGAGDPGDPQGTSYSDQTPGQTAGLSFVTNKSLGSIMTGYIEGSVSFLVHANAQQVTFACAATDLFKGNIPTRGGFSAETTHDDEIPLYADYGCRIDVPNGNPINGYSNVGVYGSNYVEHGSSGWEFLQTNYITFENNHPEPTQYVTLTTKWLQDDHEKRQGQYSGFVKLIAMVDGSY